MDILEAGMNDFDPVASARRVIALERDGLDALIRSVDSAFSATIERLGKVQGRLICSGVGKSGHVARKIAATLASTGTLAYYVHPTEASHGDLGMITPDDAVLALSKSGETRELGDLIAYCRRFSVPLIGMTSQVESTLARAADYKLIIPDAPEACGETRAPTTSTTLMMALGDALAIALLEQRGFTAADFKTFHPGGALGAALATTADIMHAGQAMPLISQSAPMSDVLIEMTVKSFGCAGILDESGRLAGIITDGDLRRHMGDALIEKTAGSIMTARPKTGSPGMLAADALREMTAGAAKIMQLFIVDEENRPQGILHLHDLLRAGLK
ncbi:arabinose-5-phosphate isomerase [Maricaulis salignorans]|uniref:Arabinose-5-phosphate isomerase n=2 Tax=Maricaulis salignorans TaxID=144026 RepID=A0A1G9QMV8_9PROT|nr:KpsF/GutQ family sugar-phosphate isomerase [Maricaulis salignorans]SDM12318.1 arabinose-5-phosphate isomerase [Maricaulis salignorans]